MYKVSARKNPVVISPGFLCGTSQTLRRQKKYKAFLFSTIDKGTKNQQTRYACACSFSAIKALI